MNAPANPAGTMQHFRRDNVQLAFFDEGAGDPIVLLHGFASNAAVNWVYTSWFDTLTQAGRRVIALDNRGHGASSKPYEPRAYHMSEMGEDVRALLDHLDIPRADLIGYSMGARIAAFFALAHPQRIHRLVFGGMGLEVLEGGGVAAEVADTLEAPSLATVADARGRTFRTFAEQTKSDLRALAACVRGSRQGLSRDEIARISMPTLVAVGTKDLVAGSAADLSALLPAGEVLDIPGRDHMLAVGDKVFKQGVVAFLGRSG
jgi:pimeloyl-ACP methyl ester carboxylesterase